MKKLIFLLFTLAQLHAEPTDQPLIIFGSSGYILYKVIDFARDHGIKYIKILTYKFHAFNHEFSGSTPAGNTKGRYFELEDDYSFIAFLCLDKPQPDDIYVIDIEKYQFLLNK
jgi:hypothetical protein